MSDFYSAVFFDMDGLFVDSEPQWLIAETELMADYGYAWKSSDQNYCLGGPLTRVGQYMFEKSGSVESPEFFTQSIIERMSIKLSQGAPVLPGALELLLDLKKNEVPTALVSASPRVLVDSVLKSIPNHTFEFSLSADDVTNPKPNPEAYLLAATKLNVDITNCLVLEDSLTGVKAATSSGAFTITVPHFVKVEAGQRLRVISSLSELSYEHLRLNYEPDKLI
jgi:HAD superfamily hydrolase (TIGR01509 family)